MGRAARVIPIIVDGEPGDAERECFPAALRFKLAADGTLTSEPEEPIAADAREQGDGKEIAKQKVVAGLLGLGLDEIVRRAERARKRKNRFWAALAGVFLFLAVAASGSAAYAWQQLKTNEAFLNATLKRATEIVDEAVAQAEKYSVPRAATLSLVVKAEGLFNDMARYGRLATRERLAKAGPNNAGWQRELSFSYNKAGDVLRAQGNLPEALKSFRAGLAIIERLAKTDPSNVQWRNARQFTIDRIGGLAYRFVLAGDVSNALDAADQVVALAPDRLWLYMNRAHALMFVGLVEEARAIYLAHRGARNASASGEKSWETAVLEDLAELRAA